jgi:hypothetical protein
MGGTPLNRWRLCLPIFRWPDLTPEPPHCVSNDVITEPPSEQVIAELALESLKRKSRDGPGLSESCAISSISLVDDHSRSTRRDFS